MSLEELIQLYNDTLSVDYRQLEWLYDSTVIHALPLMSVVLYFGMLIFLPMLVPKGGFGNPRTSTNPASLKFWRYLYFGWNMFLSVLSVFMLVGAIIPFGYYIYTHGGLIKGSWNVICNTNGEALYLTETKNTLVFWGLLFAGSKYMELLDTVLLILKNPGRKILLLHWVHHWSVLLITWYIGYYRIPVGFFYMIVNAIIHSFMYYYYAMTELGYRPSWNYYLTLGQTLQMVYGTILNILWFYGYWFHEDLGCVRQEGSEKMFIGIGLMYVTYLILFTKFFIEKYSPSKSAAPATVAEKKKSKKDD